MKIRFYKVPFIFLAGLMLLSLQNGNNKHYPKGCYMSFSELRSRNPGNLCALTVQTWQDEAMRLMGTKDFQLWSSKKCISDKSIKNDMWAYSDDKVLYVNCKKLKLETDKVSVNSFAPVLTYGRYLAFYVYFTADHQTIFGSSSDMISRDGVSEPLRTELEVIDLKAAKLFWVDSAFVAKAALEFPEIYGKFTQLEPSAKNAETQLEYLNRINEAQP